MDSTRDEIAAIRRVHRLQKLGLLAELREEAGLSQAHVAAFVGVDPSQVSRWEASKARPRARYAVRLLELLDGDAP